MLFLTDSFDGTIFWLCVMFCSLIFLLIFGFFVVYFSIHLHSYLIPREDDCVKMTDQTDKGLHLINFVFDDNNQERQFGNVLDGRVTGP